MADCWVTNRLLPLNTPGPLGGSPFSETLQAGLSVCASIRSTQAPTARNRSGPSGELYRNGAYGVRLRQSPLTRVSWTSARHNRRRTLPSLASTAIKPTLVPTEYRLFGVDEPKACTCHSGLPLTASKDCSEPSSLSAATWPPFTSKQLPQLDVDTRSVSAACQA